MINHIECYSSCKICDKKGNYSIHNCLECASEYIYELNILDRINCYKSCEFYSYYNSSNNKYYCTPGPFCPNNINKLITEKKILH